MRKSLLLSLLILCTLGSSAQAIRYSYDAAGNRVRRELVVSSAPMNRGNTGPYTDDLANDYKVKLSPLQDGIIRIDVISKAGQSVGNVDVYNTSGMRMLSSDIQDGTATVNLSDRQNGVYILDINVNGNKTSWKITKR